MKKCLKALIVGLLAVSMLFTPNLAGATGEGSTTSTFSVSVVIDISLSHVPIAWGTLAPGTTNNLALSNQGNPATITVESTTNVNVDIYIKGDDWTGPTTVAVDNCHYDTDNTPGGDNWTVLTTTYTTPIFENVPPNTVKDTYWFLDVPTALPAGDYSNTIYFKAVRNGTPP